MRVLRNREQSLDQDISKIPSFTGLLILCCCFGHGLDYYFKTKVYF